MSLFLLLACTPETTEQVYDGAWHLVWEDDFAGAAGEPPNPEYWTPEIGGDGWGNNQLEYNTDRNARLNGQGQLVITAKAESMEGNAYTSARIRSKDKVEHGDGRFEADIRIPEGQGLWPAFWLLGTEIDSLSWPACGEVDILEAKGEDPGVVYATVHGPGYSGAGGIGTSYPLQTGSFADEFYTFAVDIDPDHLTFWVNDTRVGVVRPGDLPAGTNWVFNQSWYMILNLAVGGNFVEAPGDPSVFPAEMTVDAVRIYERDAG
jgi:beta-glucanase (GH16 family)